MKAHIVALSKEYRAEIDRLRVELVERDALLDEARDLFVRVNDMFMPFVGLDGEIRKWRRALNEVMPLPTAEDVQGSIDKLDGRGEEGKA